MCGELKDCGDKVCGGRLSGLRELVVGENGGGQRIRKGDGEGAWGSWKAGRWR